MNEVRPVDRGAAGPLTAPFPSLLVRANELVPLGSFAEAQAEFLDPDRADAAKLAKLLAAEQVGIVAHFYMDAELQGVLGATDWPHIHVSDSLLMADKAIDMARAGMRAIVVLGVDFMSENVRAMLDAAGFPDVHVYRVASDPIGCSLAESADSSEYLAYLDRASKSDNPLHVIYINTSLEIKARAQAVVPTITCTSSNVVRTILQAAVDVPDVSIWFGPDTYMGQNLRRMLTGYASMTDEAIRALHPDHDRRSIASLLERFHYFEQGTCIVHHMFGEAVASTVRDLYPSSCVAAHLEVPSEMFELGLEASLRGDGVVGSTSDILRFIKGKVTAAAAVSEDAAPDASEDGPRRVSFVLGTEAGMVTSIVHDVQAILRGMSAKVGPSVDAEIVFPVAAEAVAAEPDSELGMIPGVAAGEGCSTAGGCATCPFMKMNSLAALEDLLVRIGTDPPAALAGFAPRKYSGEIEGRSIAELGSETILSMRALGRDGKLPKELIAAIRAN